jgi:guanine nucleotide exchange factor VAV
MKRLFVENKLKIIDLALELRNGVILCNLLEFLLPGSIDLLEINKYCSSSRIMSIYNLNLFIRACKSNTNFNLNDSDLFDCDMLYDNLDLSQVLRTLSIISNKNVSFTKLNRKGFNIKNDSYELYSEIYDTNTFENSLFPNEFDLNNLASKRDKKHEQIFDYYLRSLKSASYEKMISKLSKKRDLIIGEILKTEQVYIKMLDALLNE